MLSKRIRPDVTDRLRGVDLGTYLRFFDDGYFEGMRTGTVVGYVDYATCRSILDEWAGMVEELLHPESLLDVGAAYGFVVEHFRGLGRVAEGIEPSDFARARAAVPLHAGHLPDALPELGRRYDVVTCTEVLEHVPTDSVTAAFAALVERAGRYVVCLVEMGAWDQYHEDPSHIHLRPRDWWIEQAGAVAGAALDEDVIRSLDDHPVSASMGWKGRFIVLRVDGGDEAP